MFSLFYGRFGAGNSLEIENELARNVLPYTSAFERAWLSHCTCKMTVVTTNHGSKLLYLTSFL